MKKTCLLAFLSLNLFAFGSNLVNLNSTNYQELVSSNQKMVIDASSPHCGPCQRLEPIFSDLSNEYTGDVKFAKLQVLKSHRLARELGVQSIPTLIFMKNGQEVGRKSGYVSRDSLKGLIRQYLNS